GTHMNIDVTQSSGVAVVVPRGDLDMAAVPDVRSALTGLLDNGQSRLLIDLDDVTYIDSSGMGTIIAAMKQARAVGGDVRLCGLQEDVRTIFEITRVMQAMSIHPTRQEALASWRGAAAPRLDQSVVARLSPLRPRGPHAPRYPPSRDSAPPRREPARGGPFPPPRSRHPLSAPRRPVRRGGGGRAAHP